MVLPKLLGSILAPNSLQDLLSARMLVCELLSASFALVLRRPGHTHKGEGTLVTS